jgi:Mg/Co/Ni transporter MgtE
MNGLDRNTSRTFLESMDDETLADTLEESPTKTQIEVLSNLDSERAADILEEMDPDEAADLLADLPEETSSELLELMNEDNAEHVRSLLDFPPDSAGGIMTTEFGWINTGLTIGEAISFLRSSKEAQEVEDMYYIYVLDDQKQLNGVVYLRDLVMASPEVQVDALMNADPVSVSPNAQQDEVAYLMAKYNLVSIPVVDEENGKMIGIVTLDDAIDYVLPTAYKKRLPRFF